MLFQYALQVALGGGRVVFISSSDATQQRRPLLPASLDEDEAGEAFGRIGLRYISTKHELQMFFASLASPPDLLIIDAWSDIVPCATYTASHSPFPSAAAPPHEHGLSRPRDATAAHEILKTMALLKNATKARSPPGDDPSARTEETLCLVAGEEETQTEVPWWKKCPLSLLLSAPAPRPPPPCAASLPPC